MDQVNTFLNSQSMAVPPGATSAYAETRRQFLSGLATAALLGSLPRLARSEPRLDDDEWNVEVIHDGRQRIHLGSGMIKPGIIRTVPFSSRLAIYRIAVGTSGNLDGLIGIKLWRGGRLVVTEWNMNSRSSMFWDCGEPIGCDRLEMRFFSTGGGGETFLGACISARAL